MGAQSNESPQATRLDEASRRAHEAEAKGDDAAAIAAWRDYRLIRDSARPADELLAEGIALSKQAETLIGPR